MVMMTAMVVGIICRIFLIYLKIYIMKTVHCVLVSYKSAVRHLPISTTSITRWLSPHSMLIVQLLPTLEGNYVLL